MNSEFKKRFIRNWNKYFPGADLPIAFYYTDMKDEKSMISLNEKDAAKEDVNACACCGEPSAKEVCKRCQILIALKD